MFIECQSTGGNVEKIVDILEEVQDWEGLAGRLNIEINSIKTNCGTSTDQARCYRRQLVRTYCDRVPSGDPRQVATEIAFVLDVKMKKKKQAQKLREMSLGGKLLVELKGIWNISGIHSSLPAWVENVIILY